MTVSSHGALVGAEIPGVMGSHPAVDLFLHSPAGAKTGVLLPTGSAVDLIDGVRVSCVDVAVPMVIIRARDVGKTAHEPIHELAADADFMQRIKEIWVEAGLRMQLKRKDGNLMTAADIGQSETIPKVCIVGDAIGTADLAVRYFTPQTAHASLAVSGGCCLAAATLILGSVANEIAPKSVATRSSEVAVDIENPAGVLSTTVVASAQDDKVTIESAAYQRSAQVLLKGYVPLYNASERLKHALMGAAS